MFDPRNNLANEVSAQLIAHFGDKVFRTVIPRNIRLAEAPSFGKPALFHDKESRGALAYLALAGEMIRREEESSGLTYTATATAGNVATPAAPAATVAAPGAASAAPAEHDAPNSPTVAAAAASPAVARAAAPAAPGAAATSVAVSAMAPVSAVPAPQAEDRSR
jgi:hypothetical protein